MIVTLLMMFFYILIICLIMHLLIKKDDKLDKKEKNDGLGYEKYTIEYTAFYKGMMILSTLFFNTIFLMILRDVINGSDAIFPMLLFLVASMVSFILMLYMNLWRIDVNERMLVFRRFLLIKETVDLRDVVVKVCNDNSLELYCHEKCIAKIITVHRNWASMIYSARKYGTLIEKYK